MHAEPIRCRLRIAAVGPVGKTVERARVCFIHQHGLYKEGRWGDANKRAPKIYVLRHKNEILYVGITKSRLSSRFRYGLTASGKTGYYGYKWKELARGGTSPVLDLFVFRFDDGDRIEAIEAEVVYLIRRETGRWPKYQTEIHFHQADKAETQIAEQIYRAISRAD